MISHRVGCALVLACLLASALIVGLLIWGAAKLVAFLFVALGAVGVTVGLAKQAEGPMSTRGQKLADRCGQALYRALEEATPGERASLRSFVPTTTNCWWLTYRLTPTLSEIVGMLQESERLRPPVEVVRMWSHLEPAMRAAPELRP